MGTVLDLNVVNDTCGLTARCLLFDSPCQHFQSEYHACYTRLRLYPWAAIIQPAPLLLIIHGGTMFVWMSDVVAVLA